MLGMFGNSKFNRDISKWNVSNVSVFALPTYWITKGYPLPTIYSKFDEAVTELESAARYRPKREARSTTLRDVREDVREGERATRRMFREWERGEALEMEKLNREWKKQKFFILNRETKRCDWLLPKGGKSKLTRHCR
jgi:hypothetical protein